MPLTLSRAQFEEMVARAMDGVPEPFASALDEVAVVVETVAPPGYGSLFGLYVGVPLTAGPMPSGALPPRIAVYMHPMLDVCHSLEELDEQIRITVLHELGHHLGFGEERLEELGYG